MRIIKRKIEILTPSSPYLPSQDYTEAETSGNDNNYHDHYYHDPYYDHYHKVVVDHF